LFGLEIEDWTWPHISKELILKFCKLFPHFYGVANPFMSHCHKTYQHITIYYWMSNADVLHLLLFGVATKNFKPL
jgi:hypothetical protein